MIGSHVAVGGILLDSERFLINFANQTQVRALQHKDDLVYNVSAEFCQPPLCTVDQYNRGTIVRDATMAKPDDGIPPDDAWTPWPGTSYTAKPQQKVTYDSFSTSLYTIPEIGYTRGEFTRTVSNAAQFGTSFVTPVRAQPGWLSVLSISSSKSVVHVPLFMGAQGA
jgi:hypothetical protein